MVRCWVGDAMLKRDPWRFASPSRASKRSGSRTMRLALLRRHPLVRLLPLRSKPLQPRPSLLASGFLLRRGGPLARSTSRARPRPKPARRTKRIRNVGSVAHQPTGFSIVTQRICRGDRVARRQVGQTGRELVSRKSARNKPTAAAILLLPACRPAVTHNSLTRRAGGARAGVSPRTIRSGRQARARAIGCRPIQPLPLSPRSEPRRDFVHQRVGEPGVPQRGKIFQDQGLPGFPVMHILLTAIASMECPRLV